jgi:hypothetical protein
MLTARSARCSCVAWQGCLQVALLLLALTACRNCWLVRGQLRYAGWW